MKDTVKDFINAKKEMMKFFKCDDDYFIKIMTGLRWKVFESDGMYFLSYYDDTNKTDAAVLKREGQPLVYKNGEYTMVAAIDCVKTGFVFENKNQI